MKKIVLLIIMLSFISFCSKRNQNEFKTIDELAQKVIECISKQEYKTIVNLLVPDEEYKKEIFKYTPIGKQGDISAEDHFRIFIKDRRAYAIRSKIKLYQDKKILFKGIGKAKQIEKLGPYYFYRRVPIRLELTKPDGKKVEITDDDILGVVIEENSRFRLFNLFRN